MSDCTLKNNRKAALSILSGSNKFVCAWVLCDEIKIITKDFKTESNTRLKYNPRELPYWNLNGKNMDGENVKELFSVDYKLFLK
jgi:hypothetical protein